MNAIGQTEVRPRSRARSRRGRSDRGTPARWVVVAVVAAVAGLVLYWVRVAGVLHGPAALVVIGLLVVASPVAPTLSERVFLLGLAGLGWPYLLWWWKPPFDRIAILLAVCGAAVAFAVGSAVLRGARVLPRPQWLDGLPLLAALAAAYPLRPWLFPAGGAGALATLIGGVDNLGHYDMWRMIAVHGRTIEHLPPPAPGTEWAYTNYPQGFHALAATLSEMVWPGAAADTGASLAAYSRTVALVMLITVTVLVAGVSVLCSSRGRRFIALPLASVVVTAFVLGPGAELLQYGFANFLVAAGALIGASLVAALIPRIHSTVHLVALAGAVLAVAANWLILLPLAVPLVIGALLPSSRPYWRGTRREWLVNLAVVALAVVVVAQAATLVLGGTPVDALSASGGVPVPNMAALTGLSVVSLGLGVASAMTSRSGLRRDYLRLRFGIMSTSVLVLVVTAIVLGRFQVESTGHVGYYLWKVLAAGIFLGVGLVIVGLIALLPPVSDISRSRAVAHAALAVAGAVGLTQAFGYVGPMSAGVGIVLWGTPAYTTSAFRSNVDVMRGPANDLYRAAMVEVPGGYSRVAFVALPSEHPINPIVAQQWFQVLHMNMTVAANGDTPLLNGGQTDASSAADVAAHWLDTHPGGAVVVAPEIKRLLDERSVTGAVLTW